MRKLLLSIIVFMLYFSESDAQEIHDSLSEDVIKNAPYIIEGYKTGNFYCNCLNQEFYDQVLEVKLTSVLRGDDLRIGDTILLLNPRIGNGDKDKGSLIDPSHGRVSRLEFVAYWGNTGCGGQFLTLNKETIIDVRLKNKPLYILYPSSTCSCFLPNSINDDSKEVFAIKALNGLKFKTKREWYNYLKQFPNIKVPFNK